ncbi:molybdate-anion transporter-like [Argiope bruennichi]|uniref:Molybdate-anion transporter n=1 Tax=Argiope bruennichi TaxID=94029 RepID=A0A8T0F9D9_ARGBR|nr:molybdate-anion transporter-like [Argiope bruennichi]XP_055940537.1 molybdate-anion transporter-like [Argiope bruennichi]XP_055940538.1 molybdate-anion transporter-like [Argiope bruennichi]XP_055940539.1 molybdate-anion transporter-like [Argiope bruennichi]KAF8786992.1 Molybdate-anion transporter like protein [Argiope bruennichi]
MAPSNSNLTLQITKLEEPESWYTFFIYCFLFASISVCFGLQYMVRVTKSSLPAANNAHFRAFQKKYFLVYFLALFGDWLQGPYIYKLYSHYGYTNFQIAVLYVVGFSASVLFGTGAGVLADTFGRKRMCMVFCITYSLCCFMKIFPNYNILLLGRLLGGVSTSLLFSVFESWYVSEHIQNYDFPQEWISVTFSKATFWNGVLAIVAGVIANFTSDVLGWGPVSPFLLAIPCFITSCFVISKLWTENYGKQQKSNKNVCIQGLQMIVSNNLILMLGIVQSLFESVMYVFVFLWTPILDSVHPPLGIVFSIFMVCIMIGSSFYQLATYRQVQPAVLLLFAVILATVSQLGCALAASYYTVNIAIASFSFFLLEIAVGIYFPAIGYIKSECIPESHRANIMNWFRVPLNIITCIILLSLHGERDAGGNCVIFLICSGMMFCCSVIMMKILKILPYVTASTEQMC